MKKILLLLVMLTLAACTTQQPTEVTRLAVPEDSWLTNVQLAPPPEREAFITASEATRVEMLQETLSKQYRYIAEKNEDLAAARAWKASMLKRYPTATVQPIKE